MNKIKTIRQFNVSTTQAESHRRLKSIFSRRINTLGFTNEDAASQNIWPRTNIDNKRQLLSKDNVIHFQKQIVISMTQYVNVCQLVFFTDTVGAGLRVFYEHERDVLNVSSAICSSRQDREKRKS